MQLSLQDVLAFYVQQLHHRPYQPPSIATADLTLTDWFCGFGGGTIGAHQVKGARLLVTSAFNHNPTCIQVHSRNHPDTDHGCVDITAFEASYFPGATCAIFAPECKYHTTANGNAALRDWEGQPQQQLALDFWIDEEVTQKHRQSTWNKMSERERQTALYRAERSRMTMGQVAKMAAYHKYTWFIVENVVQVRRWRHFKAWVNEIKGLGYQVMPVYLNAAMVGVPQLRDLVFFFCYKAHLPTPNLRWRPLAWCPRCKAIGLSEQRWKKWQHDPIDPLHPGGKYGNHAQYLYHCCQCGEVAYPYARPAQDIVDWNIPCVPIGQRQEHKLPPLKETTRGRIGAGLRRYAGTHLLDTTYSQAGVSGKTRGRSEPLPAQTTRQSFALAMAPGQSSIGTQTAPVIQLGGQQAGDRPQGFIATLRGKQPQNSPIDAPISTLTTSGAHHGLTVLPQDSHHPGSNTGNKNAFIMGYYSRNNAHSEIHQPLPTLTPEPRFGIATLPSKGNPGGLRAQVVGNIGSPKRAKYTIIGAPVNLASWLESLAVGGQVFISQTTFDAVGPILRIDGEMQVQLKGIREAIPVYQVGGIGGRFNLVLPASDTTLTVLQQAIPLQYVVLQGKQATAQIYWGRLVRLGEHEAELRSPTPLPNLANLKLNLVTGVAKARGLGDLYAKVTDHWGGERYHIRFTAVPPEIAALLYYLRTTVAVALPPASQPRS